MPAISRKPVLIPPPSSGLDCEVGHFIEAAGNTSHSFGLGKLIGRLFALLYFTPEPLCLDQIAKILRISKASASITVRQLAAWKAVHKVEDTEGRRDFYQVELRFGVILNYGLLPVLQKKLLSAGTQIDRALEHAPTVRPIQAAPEPEATRERNREICRRLRLARGLHQKISALVSSSLLEHLA